MNAYRRTLVALPLRSIFSLHCGVQCKRYASDISNSSPVLPRQRRDDIWIPTINLKPQGDNSDATQLLARAGYLRQAYSGIYHILPLGLRVQEKLEALIDKHMKSIGASKVSLSSLSSESLWQRSGRLEAGSELFKFCDRKDSRWLLAPTHEEEITSLVRDAVHSSNQLPVRLYQISRKYRDEKRPRGGLLRGREFIMKDLYTFDFAETNAHLTYDQVRGAYRNFFDELGVPYVEARADSGSMGGNLSHEYHFPSPVGEDDVITCNMCDFARNEEWVPNSNHSVRETTFLGSLASSNDHQVVEDTQLVSASFLDSRKTCLVKVFAQKNLVHGQPVEINTYSVKSALSGVLELDTGIENAEQVFQKAIVTPEAESRSSPNVVYYLFDKAVSIQSIKTQLQQDRDWLIGNRLPSKLVLADANENHSLSLLKQSEGDSCPQCKNGILKVQKAIEVGHTFHLGTRYSSKLDLTVKSNHQNSDKVNVEMGCHGIGVSRLLAAITSAMSDPVGLNWPATIAPYHIVILVDGNDSARLKAAEGLYDTITSSNEGSFDVLLDDRKNVSNGYKLKDADLIGYPIIVVVGRTFGSGQFEVQCRQKGVKEAIDIETASSAIQRMLLSLL